MSCSGGVTVEADGEVPDYYDPQEAMDDWLSKESSDEGDLMEAESEDAWSPDGISLASGSSSGTQTPLHEGVSSDECIIVDDSDSDRRVVSEDGDCQLECGFAGITVEPADDALRRHCFGKGSVLSVQVVVVLQSVVRALSVVKRDLLTSLASELGVQPGRKLLLRTAAAISGISAKSVRRASENTSTKLQARLRHEAATRDAQARRDRRVRGGTHGGGARPADLRKPTDADRRTAMKNIIRTAIASAVEGQSFCAYERNLHRMRLASAQVGHRYEDRRFAARTIQLAGLVLKQLDAHDWQSRLPGIGIASDFAVLADPVSLGTQIRTKHDVLNVMCLCIVGCGGQIHCPLLDAPAMPFGSHGGSEMCKLMAKTLEDHPAGFGRGVLRRRLSSVCGDGALTLGGPDHRHSSTKAAEFLWRTVHEELQGSLPDMTVWDPFHRVDVAAWRAVRRVPMAKAVFDTARQLDSLFGMDEGVLLYRGAAAALATKAAAIRAPGATRKVGFLAGTPGSVLQNYKAVIGSMHARLEWISAGRSVQTLTNIAEVCRILTDVSFIAFSAFLDDLLGGTLRPFSTQVQKAIEPAVFAQAQRRIMGRLRDLPDQLRSVRQLLRVISLCRQWASRSELSELWRAHSSSRAGLVLPNFWRAVADILATATPCYQGVELASAEFLDPSVSLCLGPHCQCVGRIAAGAPRAKRSTIVIHGRRLLVPLWVAHGNRLRPYDGDLVGVSARWQTRPLGAAVPSRLTNVLRLRRSTCTGCRVPHQFYISHDSIDGALKAAAKLVVELHSELDGILGSVGVNDGMAKLLQNSSRCFDWGSLATHAPSAVDVKAFRQVASTMEPLMKLTEYPAHVDFDSVGHTWPTLDELCVQYMMLCRRVRDVAAAALLHDGDVLKHLGHDHGRDPLAPEGQPPRPEGAVKNSVTKVRRPPREVLQAARRWSKIVACTVSPVWSRGVLRHVLGVGLARAGPVPKSALYTTCTLVCLFEGAVPPEAFKTYRVSANELSFPRGFPRTRRLAIKASCNLENYAGTRKLVRVIKDELAIDISAVSAAIDMHSWFSIGGGSGSGSAVCWHAARLHHRCRLLAPPDTACEGIGSQIRWLWDQRMGKVSPTVFADKLRLTSAGVSCLGGGRDETIIERILHMLETGASKKLTPFHGARARLRRMRGGQAAQRLARLRDSGRSHWSVDDDHLDALSVSLWEEAAPGLAAHHSELASRARAGWPTALPQLLMDALSRLSRGTKMPTVPPSVDLMRVDGRNAAGSVRNRAIADWFESADGQEWAAERRRLLHHGEPDAVICDRSRDIAGAGSGDIAGASGEEANGDLTAEVPASASGAPPPPAAAVGIVGGGRGHGDASAGGRGRGRGRGVANGAGAARGRGVTAASGRGRGQDVVCSAGGRAGRGRGVVAAGGSSRGRGRGRSAPTASDVGVVAPSADSSGSAAIGGAAAKRRRCENRCAC